ncbi:MAG: glycosyltransferase 87 family protein [Oscillochloridaceae bacterium umkhey_bin13]
MPISSSMPRGILALTALTVFLASVLTVIGLLRPLPAPLLTGLHQREWSELGTYRWTQPDFRLTVPVWQAQPQLVLAQRLNAGPLASDTRPIRISANGLQQQFLVEGGGPGRIYRYVLPTSGPFLVAEYQLAPLAGARPGDDRALGVIIYDQPPFAANPTLGPAMPTLLPLLVAGLLPLSLVTLMIWLPAPALGPARRRLLAGVTLALAISLGLLVGLASDDLLIPGVLRGLWVGLAVLASSGLLLRGLLIQADPSRLILALTVAAVSLPLFFVFNGLWSNLGREWDGLRPVLVGLLLTPPLLAALSLTQRPWLAPTWAAGLAVAAVAAFGLGNLLAEFAPPPYDFAIYWRAAQRHRMGEPIYEVALLRSKPFEVFKYHPSFLLLILPLSELPLATAALLWRLGQVTAVALALIALLVAVLQRQAWLWLSAVLLLLSFSPVTLMVRLGQVDGLLLLLITLAVTLALTRWRTLGGVLYGFVAVLKVYPAAVMAADAAQRRWSVLLGAGAGGAGLVLVSVAVFGWANELTFWREVVPSLGLRTIRLSNQSLYGLIGRTLFPELAASGNLATNLPLVAALHAGAALLVAAVTLWAGSQILRHASPIDASLALASLICCLVLLVIPVSWDHYQVLLALPLLAAFARLPAVSLGQRLLLLGAWLLLAYGTYKHVAINLSTSDLVLWFASYRTFGLILLWLWWIRQATTGWSPPSGRSAAHSLP